MDAKEAKQVLSQLQHIDRRMVEIRRRIADQAGGTDLDQQLRDLLDAAERKRYHIQASIDKLPAEDEKRILELRYIDQRSWTAIMRTMHISRSQSFRLHMQALEDFAKMYG